MDILGVTEKLANCIIRPPRVVYSLKDLGEGHFEYSGKIYQRLDFTVQSVGSVRLQCSMYKEKHNLSTRPTVIYLHANSSCRVSVKNYLRDLIGDFDVVAFDFRGCGNSDGKYLTLGYLEKEDVRAVVQYISRQFGKRKYMLWGRSMGAATAILYAAKYRGVCSLVLDSPFADLEKVIYAIADNNLPILPDFMIGAAIENLEGHIQEKIKQQYSIKYKIRRLKPISCIGMIAAPIFFVGSKNDELVNSQQIVDLYDAAISYKELEMLDGGHNQARPAHLKEAIVEFLQASLKKQPAEEQDRRKIFGYRRRSSRDILDNEPTDKKLLRQSQMDSSSRQQKIDFTQNERSSNNRGPTRSRIFTKMPHM